MQRLYAMFPDGRPGSGLLLLRVHLALTLLATLDVQARPVASVLIGCAAALLLLGLLVPVLAVLLAITWTWLLAQRGLPWMLGLPPLLVSLAVLGLGPGAYSLDARLFGRRLVTLRKSPRS